MRGAEITRVVPSKTQFRCLFFSPKAFILCRLLAVLFSSQVTLKKVPLTEQWTVD